MIKVVKKRGQEEIVGFVVIVVIVSIILLVLLSFFIKNPSNEVVNNYEVGSFIQSAMQYTSNCEDTVEFLAVQDLIVACGDKVICVDSKDSCEVLNETIKSLIEKGWNVGNQSAVKGYKFSISEDGQGTLLIKGGNETINYKGTVQPFAKEGKSYEVLLNVYE
jgi:hypothetical protein